MKTKQPNEALEAALKTLEGVKHDKEKNRLDLLSPWATEGLGLVLTHGSKKYTDHNWRQGLNWSRLIGAAKRHLSAFERGENLDPDSGLPHIDHAAACIHFLSEYQKLENGTDDRWRPAEPTVYTPYSYEATWSTDDMDWEVISKPSKKPRTPKRTRRSQK